MVVEEEWGEEVLQAVEGAAFQDREKLLLQRKWIANRPKIEVVSLQDRR